MGLLSVIVEIIKAIAMWLQYKFDPELVKQRLKQAEEEKDESARQEMDSYIVDGQPLQLGAFISARLRSLRQQTSNNSDSGQGRSVPVQEILGRKLPHSSGGSDDKPIDSSNAGTIN